MFAWLKIQFLDAKLNSSDEYLRREAAEKLYQLMIRGNSAATNILLNRL